MTLTLQGQTPGQFTIQAVASASNDQNSSNNNGQGIVRLLTPSTNVPLITNPTPESILSGSTVTFKWVPNGLTVMKWWVQIGSSQGAVDLADSGSLGTTLSYTVSGLPTDGRVVWVRLWYQTAQGWQSIDVRYTAATQNGGTTPQIVSPTPGSKLSGSTVTFNWVPNGLTVTKWWVQIGSSQGAVDLADSGSLGTTLSYTVSGLPTDGRVVWVRLWYQTAQGWQSIDVHYTAATQNGGTTPQIVSPTPGSKLSGSTVTFNWVPNGLTVMKWWVQIGSSQGAVDLADSGSLGTTLSYTVSGLPTDGRVVWVRLWYLTLAGWQSIDIQYTAATQG